MSTTARATLTVEIYALGSWGKDCQLDQVYKQAAEAAIGRLENCKDLRNIRIIGKPIITAVLVEEDKR